LERTADSSITRFLRE